METEYKDLLELLFPTTSGGQAAGMKREDELVSLRNENFRFKLKQYFIEKKLGIGAPPSIKELLEENAQLQIEIEALKKRFSDQQALLAEAIAAIDLLQKQEVHKSDLGDAQCAKTESDARDNHDSTINEWDSHSYNSVDLSLNVTAAEALIVTAAEALNVTAAEALNVTAAEEEIEKQEVQKTDLGDDQHTETKSAAGDNHDSTINEWDSHSYNSVDLSLNVTAAEALIVTAAEALNVTAAEALNVTAAEEEIEKQEVQKTDLGDDQHTETKSAAGDNHDSTINEWDSHSYNSVDLSLNVTAAEALIVTAAEALNVTAAEALNVTAAEEEIEKQEVQKTDLGDDQHTETKSAAGDNHDSTVNIEDWGFISDDSLDASLNVTAADKEIQHENKELTYTVSDSQMKKYGDILKSKDEHITDLESKVRELQKSIDSVQNQDNSGNLQEVLTRRLEGLTYFLDKLLSHKCMLGEDKKKLAESILEQSLALSVGLKLDESMASETFGLDDSTSQSRIQNFTMRFGLHNMACSDDNKCCSACTPKSYPQADVLSESECCSERDANVSLTGVGLCDTDLAAKEYVSESNRYRSRCSKKSYGSRSEDNKTLNEGPLLDKITDFSKRLIKLEDEKNDLNSKLDFAMIQIKDLISEKYKLKSLLDSEILNVSESKNNIEVLKNTNLSLESKILDLNKQLSETMQVTEKLRTEKQELESTFIETERALRRDVDEANFQASQAATKRARAEHDRLRYKRKLKESQDKLNIANAELKIELKRKEALKALFADMRTEKDGIPSEEDVTPSSHQGIDSDRLSSYEHNDAVALSPRSLYEENLARGLTQKNNEQDANVLRKARDQLDHETNTN